MEAEPLLGRSGCDGEVGGIGESLDVCGRDGARDGGGVFCSRAGCVARDGGWIINGVDGQVITGCGVTIVIGDGDDGIVAIEVGVGV